MHNAISIPKVFFLILGLILGAFSLFARDTNTVAEILEGLGNKSLPDTKTKYEKTYSDNPPSPSSIITTNSGGEIKPKPSNKYEQFKDIYTKACQEIRLTKNSYKKREIMLNLKKGLKGNSGEEFYNKVDSLWKVDRYLSFAEVVNSLEDEKPAPLKPDPEPKPIVPSGKYQNYVLSKAEAEYQRHIVDSVPQKSDFADVLENLGKNQNNASAYMALYRLYKDGRTNGTVVILQDSVKSDQMLDKAVELGNPFAIQEKYGYSEPPEGDYSPGDIDLTLKGGIQLKLKWIDCKSYVMGSPDGEIGRDKKEYQQKVYFNYPGFFVGECEVTQEQYQTVMGVNPSKFQGARKPVENVSYDDAKFFCSQMTTEYKDKIPEGFIFELPTEAQWEYACRAGTTQALNSNYPLENKNTSNYLNVLGWYKGNSNKMTHEVKSGGKKPNAWGLYDMHGNVAEWTEGGILRGGSWNDAASKCRSASKSSLSLSARSNTCGFRVVLVPQIHEEAVEPIEGANKKSGTGLRLF